MQAPHYIRVSASDLHQGEAPDGHQFVLITPKHPVTTALQGLDAAAAYAVVFDCLWQRPMMVGGEMVFHDPFAIGDALREFYGRPPTTVVALESVGEMLTQQAQYALAFEMTHALGLDRLNIVKTGRLRTTVVPHKDDPRRVKTVEVFLDEWDDALERAAQLVLQGRAAPPVDPHVRRFVQAVTRLPAAPRGSKVYLMPPSAVRLTRAIVRDDVTTNYRVLASELCTSEGTLRNTVLSMLDGLFEGAPYEDPLHVLAAQLRPYRYWIELTTHR